MTGVAHNPVVQNISMWVRNVLKTDTPGPEFGLVLSTQTGHIEFGDIYMTSVALDKQPRIYRNIQADK